MSLAVLAIFWSIFALACLGIGFAIGWAIAWCTDKVHEQYVTYRYKRRRG